MRPSRRQVDELRAVSLERSVVKYAEGSCFVKFGDTHVLVTASLEERLPPWLKGQGRGWVTAEYGMLPRATAERTRREASAGKQGGRTVEIQQLRFGPGFDHQYRRPLSGDGSDRRGTHYRQLRNVPHWPIGNRNGCDRLRDDPPARLERGYRSAGSNQSRPGDHRGLH